MIHLLWGFLNFVVIFYVLYIIFKALRLVREKMGMLSVLVIVFGLMSFVNANTPEKTHTPKQNKSLADYKMVKLEEGMVTSYTMGVRYQKVAGSIIPVDFDAHQTGFVLGTDFKTTDFTIKKFGNKFTYELDAIVKWKLMGMEIYSESKSYKGILP